MQQNRTKNGDNEQTELSGRRLKKPPSDLLLDNRRRVVVRLQVLAMSDGKADDNGDEGDEEGEDEVAAPPLAAPRLQQVLLVVLLGDAVAHALKDFLYTLRRNLLNLVQSRLKFHVSGT